MSKPLQIALVGYGKMGRILEKVAAERGHVVTCIVDPGAEGCLHSIERDAFAGVDVTIEFTHPDAVLGNLEQLASLGVNVVIGTTGWSRYEDQIRHLVEQSGIGCIWGANFSVGVNVFLRTLQQAARLMSERSEYAAWAYEAHHAAKKDAPSGTLLRLVDAMRESGWDRSIDIGFNRVGSIPGTHVFGFDSDADTITLQHTARNRNGFALGAIVAAEWIHGKTGFFEFGDALFPKSSE